MLEFDTNSHVRYAPALVGLALALSSSVSVASGVASVADRALGDPRARNGCQPPALMDGTGGDAAADAAGLGQMFEQISVPGITDFDQPTNGYALVDLDGDGMVDVFLVHPTGLRLMLNSGCFTFEAHPLTLLSPLVGEVRRKGSPTFADFNGDGFLDFYLPTVGNMASSGRAQLFLSQGAWDVFEDYAPQMGVENRGAYARGQVSVGDVSGDGYLDMAVGANQIGNGGGGRPLSRLYVYRPSADGVYENGRFEDVGGTDVIPGFGGVDYDDCDPENDKNGFVAVLRDWDDDGDLDLIHVTQNDMLGGDPSRPCPTGECPYGVYAWRNLLEESGELRFAAVAPGPDSIAEHGKMRYDPQLGYYLPIRHAVGHEGLSTADVDNDGDLDVLTTGGTQPDWHVNSGLVAGKFWYNQGGFRFRATIALNPVPQALISHRRPEDYRHFSTGEEAGLESLNWTVGQWLEFWDAEAPSESPSWSRACAAGPQVPLCRSLTAFDRQHYPGSTLFADLDNDGWLDMLFAIRGVGSFGRGVFRNVLYMNNRDGTFRPTTTELSGISEAAMTAHAVDLDGDGLLDLYFMRRGPVEGGGGLTDRVFWNRGEHGGARHHWLEVKLQGLPQRELIGARVIAYSSGEGELLGRRDYFVDMLRGSHDPDVHFGLGDEVGVDLMVILPDGRVRWFRGIPVDRKVALDVMSGEDGGMWPQNGRFERYPQATGRH